MNSMDTEGQGCFRVRPAGHNGDTHGKIPAKCLMNPAGYGNGPEDAMKIECMKIERTNKS